MTEHELTALESKVEQFVYAYRPPSQDPLDWEVFGTLSQAARLWLESRRAARGGEPDA